jgi:hypothetical protein
LPGELFEGDPVIGLFIKIPFHSQIRSAEPRLAAEIEGAVDEVVSAFAASKQAIEESFLLGFDESSRPCRLRAAEAARLLALKLSGLAPRLHGWAMILDAGASGTDESLRIVKRLWFDIDGDGLYLSAHSKSYFADYFRFGPQGEASRGEAEGMGCLPILDAIYARPALPAFGQANELVEEAPAQVIDRLVDAIGELGIGQKNDRVLAVLGPGRGPSLCLDAAVSKLYGDSARRFIRLSASAVESSPYGPIAKAFAAIVSPKRGVSGPGALLSGAERSLLEELWPMLDFLQRSPYRRGYSPQIGVRLRLCTAAALRFYAREMRSRGLPAFVIMERVESFPEQSLELILGLVTETLAGEGLTILAAGADLPSGWSGLGARCLEVPGPSSSAFAKAALRGAEAIGAPGSSASLAMAAAGDPQRLKLALRLLASGQTLDPAASTESLAAQALASFPREYGELLLALRLGEETLTDECMEDFLNESGYVQGIRAPAYEGLAELGFVTLGQRPRIASSATARSPEEALADGGKAVRADFAGRLLLLKERGLVLPSTALYMRMREDSRRRADGGMEEARDNFGLLLDCIYTDDVYGPSELPSKGGQGSGLEALTTFFISSSLADRESSLASLERLEAELSARSTANQVPGSVPSSGLELAEPVASLARAAFEYADGRAQNAAGRAKKALMGLHALGARKAEAKAHRILGLCSLAQEQVQEGADYLANAYDMASALPEPLECILSAIAEAAAAFVLGDLGRAASRADAAASWAASAFRADWESVCAFVKGRAALEVGRYEEAEEQFGRVRTVARVYGQGAAARRAEIWTGRAAAFAGEAMRAREILGRYDDDVEALWFLAELEAWEGAPGKALSLAEAAMAILPRHGFFPAEAFDWGSGYASLEGRAVGFSAGRSYLGDQVEAFREFLAGMAAPEKDGLASAARLSALVREDRLAALHPAAHLYLFYRYLILERLRPSSMDGATALSKAFKAQQLRSARIGETAQKDGFLGTNRWNRALLEAARSRKLI